MIKKKKKVCYREIKVRPEGIKVGLQTEAASEGGSHWAKELGVHGCDPAPSRSGS